MANQAESLFQFFFVKPVFGILLAGLLLVAGLLACQSMIKEANPDLAIPQAIVTTAWEGASPELIEKQITNEIEKEVKTLKGLKRYRSGSLDSTSVIAVEFVAEASIEESLQLLRAKVNQAEANLPKEAKKPKIEQVSVTDTPILTLMLYGDLDDSILNRAARFLEQRLDRLSGIRKVELAGSREEVVQIQLHPDRIRALRISPTQIRDTIRRTNQDAPWGKFENDEFTATLNLVGRFRDMQEIRDLPVARLDGGRVIRLREVASVRRDLESDRVRTWLSLAGEEFRRGVSLSLYKSPGQDSIELAIRASQEIERAKLSPDWPHSLEYAVVSNESPLIWEQLKTAFDNCWQAMLAVFVVLLLMLTWREALIAGLAIPLTFLGTLAVLYALGYTLNTLVVIGMVMALGLLVDVFILVMEGMHEAIFVEAKSFVEAVRYTVRTFALPAFAGQMTTILALAPLFAIGGIDGKFIRQIPVTEITCLLLSFVIAFLVCVPLSRYLLDTGRHEHTKTRVDVLTERASSWLTGWLKRFALRNRLTALLWCGGATAGFFVCVLAARMLPSLLYPKQTVEISEFWLN